MAQMRYLGNGHKTTNVLPHELQDGQRYILTRDLLGNVNITISLKNSVDNHQGTNHHMSKAVHVAVR